MMKMGYEDSRKMELAECHVQQQALNLETLNLRVTLQTAINAMHLSPMMDRGSSVAVVSRLRSKQSRNRGSLFPPGATNFSFPPKHPEHLRILPSSLFNGYLRKYGRGVKLTTHHRLMPRLRISGAMYSNGTNKCTQEYRCQFIHTVYCCSVICYVFPTLIGLIKLVKMYNERSLSL